MTPTTEVASPVTMGTTRLLPSLAFALTVQKTIPPVSAESRMIVVQS